MEILEIFKEIVRRRNNQLKRYDEVDEKIFHDTVRDGTWSSEEIFRHILMGLGGIRNIISGDKKQHHPLTLYTGKIIEDKKGIEDVKEALDSATKEIIVLMEQTTQDRWKEESTNFLGQSLSIETQVMGLIFHESEHLGELKWIFKRLTGWGDQEMYQIVKK